MCAAEATLLGLQTVSLHTESSPQCSLCAPAPLVSPLFLIRTPVLLDQGPTLTTSFNLNHLLKALLQILSCWGLGLLRGNLRWTRFSP